MSVVDCCSIYTLCSLQTNSAYIYDYYQQQKKTAAFAADLNTLNGQEMRHERITNHLGEICRRPTTTQKNKHGRATGNSITANCYICHKYMKKANATNYVQMAFHCSDCKMPVCKIDRSNERRPNSCYLEHKTSKDSIIG